MLINLFILINFVQYEYPYSMNIKTLVLLSILFSGISINSKASDTLVFEHELIFQSSLEESVYKSVLAGEESRYFDAFYVLTDSSDINIESAKKALVNQIKSVKPNKKETKFVKNVYSSLHERFFRKYVEKVFFDEVFSNGYYNCVSACAIYGLAFQELDIPFAIKETPTHVYIVAYPDSHQILIETTDPVGGYASFSSAFKQTYVETLLELKLIDASDMAMGVNALFDKHYFNDSNLGLKELVAIQYYNQGIFLAEKEKFYESYQAFSKAYVLYPSEHIANSLTASLVNELISANYEEDYHFSLLSNLPRHKTKDLGNEEILGEFNRITEKYLIDRNETEKYELIYNDLLKGFKDSTLRSDMQFYYNYERARLLYNKGRYVHALPFAEEAFAVKEKNADAETLLISTYMNYLSRSKNTEKALSRLEGYMSRFSGLKENNHVNTAWLNLNLMAMEKAFTEKNETDGKSYKSNFEQAVSENEIADYDDFLVGRAYSAAAVFYFKKGYYKSANTYLKKGLEYSPRNQELKSRQYMLNRN